ncbi:MAG: hypothetical protein GX042_11665 [Bacteroidales bacterium]|nr:hypothetical protein [Bacteroidales bacterium]
MRRCSLFRSALTGPLRSAYAPCNKPQLLLHPVGRGAPPHSFQTALPACSKPQLHAHPVGRGSPPEPFILSSCAGRRHEPWAHHRKIYFYSPSKSRFFAKNLH